MSKNQLLLGAGAVAFAGALFAGTWYSLHRPEPAPPPAGFTELDPKKQKQIWDNEHITFELEQRFGKKFREALRGGRGEDLQSFLREGFTSTSPLEGGKITRRKGYFTEVEHHPDHSPKHTEDAEGFAKRLLAVRGRFAKVERDRLRVLTIRQTGTEPPRWEAELFLEIVGTDAKGELLYYASHNHGTFTIPDAFQLDTAASLDRWVMDKETWRASERPLLEEVTEAAGLDKAAIHDNWTAGKEDLWLYPLQVAVADYNNDGSLDIAVGVYDKDPLLLEGGRGVPFKNVAGERGLAPLKGERTPRTNVAAWIDYDNDGWPDLLVGDRLFHNREGKRFEDVTEGSGVRIEPECMGIAVADYNGDGLLDLYVLYQKDLNNPSQEKAKWVDDQDTGRANQLLRNEGGGRFRDVTRASNAGGGNRRTFAASWFYYDDDHHPDLYVANDFGKNVVLRNQGDGTFEDVSARSGAEDYATSMGVATGDINNDGRPDIYVANMFSKMGRRIIGQVGPNDYPPGVYEQIAGACVGNRLYLGSATGYRDVSGAMAINEVGWAFAPSLFDLDGDGWLDIYATAGFVSFDRGEPDG